MLNPGSYLIPLEAKKALVVSDSEWGLEELEGLLKTLGGEAVEKLKLPHRRVDPGTYMGSGKLEEVARILEARGLDMLLVDFDLSPSQLKNVERRVKRLVLDRSGIILEIFSRHARTKEAKLQVEMARLQYLMPRLTHLWSHFERQRGSGGGALKGKGMGEKQIEVDRRLVKQRVAILKKKLRDVEESRELHRAHREALLKVAIVGYTNAGKSTILNALTRSEVLADDTLFATLDASVRLLNPKSRPVILAIDTVGFIDRLPHGLVASFRTTLASVLEADLLLHVLDASHPEVRRHFEVTMKVLSDLGADKIPMLLVFNKVDRVKDAALLKVWAAGLARENEEGTNAGRPMFLSAFDAGQVNELRERILKFFDRAMETYEIVVPYEDGKLAAKLFEFGSVETKRQTAKGTYFRLRTLPQFADQLNLSRFKA